MRRKRSLVVAMLVMSITGCASIPPEAPELSAQLGARMSSMESAHIRLLEEFFLEKRRQVDEFIQKVWVPRFAEEFFSDPRVDAVWKEVVQSRDPNDRVQFIASVGPKLQEKINRKRLELIQPLDELERTIKAKLMSEYDQTRAINTSLTAFLQSASKVEENRKRYLDLVGITDQEVDDFINETDQAVSQLVDAGRSIGDAAQDAEAYRGKLKEIIDGLKK